MAVLELGALWLFDEAKQLRIVWTRCLNFNIFHAWSAHGPPAGDTSLTHFWESVERKTIPYKRKNFERKGYKFVALITCAHSEVTQNPFLHRWPTHLLVELGFRFWSHKCSPTSDPLVLLQITSRDWVPLSQALEH